MKTVLVVDDMAIVREPIAASLRMAGFETICAEDGDEALDVVKRRRPDLILLDLAMPRMDGLAFLRETRGMANIADVPVILLTAIADREHVVEAARLGIRDYMLKSQFSLKQLVARVQSQLRSLSPSPSPSQTREAGPAAPSSQNQPPAARITSGATTILDTPAAPAAARISPRPAAGIAAEPRIAAPGAPIAAPRAAAVAAVGAPADALRSLKPLVTRTQITELIDNCGELKALSPSVMQIIKLTSSPNCSIDQVVRTIKQDHAISLKVLKLANSTVYTRGEPVESVQKAVMRIGLSQIRQAVLNIAVIEQFSSEALDRHVNSMHFWEHSIACGLICSEIARAAGLNEHEIDSAFTMGLLHDVGRLVYADKLGETYGQVLQAAAELELPLEQVETRLLLVNHADAMDRVLHGWRFPKPLINPIAFHHLSMGNIRHMARNMVQEVAMLALADRLAHALLLGDSGNQTLYPIEEYCRALKLDASVIAEIEKRIPDAAHEMKFAMLSRGNNQQNWPPARQVIRQKLTAPVRPIYISAAPEIDAYRIAIDQLKHAEVDADEPAAEIVPNIAVVHVTDARERATVTAALHAAEAAAGVTPLPTLLISPSGAVQLEEAPGSRRVENLVAPTHLTRFLGALNRLTANQ